MNRKELERQIKWLGEALGTDLELSTWAPGDGWTRYQVIEAQTGKCPGRELFGTHRVFGKKEIEAAVLAARNAVDYIKYPPKR